MPWQPRDFDAMPDHRFDAYRERAGRLHRNGEEAGFTFVRLRPSATQTGGALWWRRWSAPTEAVHQYYLLADGTFADSVTDVADLEDEIEDWAAGHMPFFGETLEVEWLPDAESARVRDDVFQLERDD